MDENRIVDKLDKLQETMNNFITEIRVDMENHEQRITQLEVRNNKQDIDIEPIKHVNWLWLQIPVILSLIGTMIALAKVFGKIP
jgi:hypothetical protein